MAQEQDRQHPFVIEPLAVSIIVLLFSLFPLLSARGAPAMAAILCIIALLACARRWKNAAPLAIFCAACALLALADYPSQLVFALGLGVYFVACRSAPWMRDAVSWLRKGVLTREVVLLSCAAVLLSAAALITWFLLLRPDIADLIATFVPQWRPVWLVAGGLLFSMINAAVEEGAYRGVIMAALEKAVAPSAALVAQAAAFGTMHINGFPRGWLGVALAFVFGLMMGLIRRRAGGMLAPWAAHVGADIVVVGVVLMMSRS